MGKIYSRQIFKVTEDLSVLCECEDTRSGFRHLAYIMRGGGLTGDKPVKCTYLNRTWENFEFQTVLRKLSNNAEGLTEEERTIIYNIQRGG